MLFLPSQIPYLFGKEKENRLSFKISHPNHSQARQIWNGFGYDNKQTSYVLKNPKQPDRCM